jgi:DNA-binding response OmpR family regulator
MDLRVLVLVADHDFGQVVRTQVENLGCRCSLAETYDEAGPAIGWADAAVIDLAGDGLDDLNRLRVEAPAMRILAIAPDAMGESAAANAGVDQILVEPFSIVEIAERVRLLARDSGDAEVVDLRTGERATAPEVDDAPWWATKTH